MLNFSVFDDIKRWSRRRSTSARSSETDSLDAFGSERGDELPAQDLSPAPGLLAWVPDRRTRVGILVTLAIILAGGLTGYLLQKWPTAGVQAASGSVTIESDP